MRIEDYLIEGPEELLAHTAQSGSGKAPEALAGHSDLVFHYMDKLAKHNGLYEALQRAIDSLTVDGQPLSAAAKALIVKWFKAAVYLHDLGKMNPAFQKKRMKSLSMGKLRCSGDSSHALLSALLYLDIQLDDLEATVSAVQAEEVGFLKQIIYAFAYVISRHHTYLGNAEEENGEHTDFEMQLDKLYKSIIARKPTVPDYVYYYRYQERLRSRNPIEQVLKSRCERVADSHGPFPFYILTKLLYSTLAACDFYATHAYDTGEELDFFYFGGDRPLLPVWEAFQNTRICRGIAKFRNDPATAGLSGINRLRSSLFIDTERELLQNLDKQLYYLEAPTGAGKTYMSVNLALTLLKRKPELNKIVYVFPFNALVEQTKQALDRIFPQALRQEYPVQVINSITPIVSAKEVTVQAKQADTEEPGFDFKAVLLQRQMLQYPLTLTSHVNFFNYLFGIGRESNLALTHLCNSVIILDEIQSYKNSIWKEIIHFLQSFAKLLNLKIIVMSATLPNLDLLVGEENCTCPLVTQRDLYFQHPLFRDRVDLHFELLSRYQVITGDELLTEVQQQLAQRREQGKPTRLLIEFISKGSARSFYRRLQAMNLEMPLFELTGDDSNLVRKKVLQQLGTNDDGEFLLPNAIVVATQVIEAGVDIDMDIGFKDISILDGEEQFLGRINRSCLREDCHAFFFNLVKATGIYRDDLRTLQDLQVEDCRRMLRDKSFGSFYQLILERMNDERQKANPKHWNYFIKKVQQLQFKDVEKDMRLITEKHYTLFIAHQVTCIDENGTEVTLDGTQVWAEFNTLLADREMEYSEKQVKLSQLREKMAYFTFNFGNQTDSRSITPQIYTEIVGDMYYIADGERFMELDNLTGAKKFNREGYIKEEMALLL
ncbi:CRISPR-associated helicase/endonuclease Cas3 [Propionispora vibrioides]|uniref:CRISPR-associated endonuclease/helicase Cas3 n=1 Tax=Propionispora vibrioides TaxID=112903 RepID=A0A1H8VRZ5_9FIRM|nr:CRISPR-associated helicase/endonuclease Cas3 [Propionispora vibrioides]SEP18060.1 CRISPR-associated endonuclease/helicase Cas3 [Propionispora vibrioides]